MVMSSLFEKDIQFLKGIGEKRAEQFRRLHIFSIGDLLRFYPRSYEDWSEAQPIAAVPFGELCIVRGTVLNRPIEQRIRKGMTVYKVRVTDGERDLLLTYFNNPYIMALLKEGETFRFRGKMAGTFLRREMNSPDFLPDDAHQFIRPIYPLTEGLSNRTVIKAMQQAFLLLPQPVRDPIPEDLLLQQGLCSLDFALCNIHFPSTMHQVETARKRLAFEEFLVL